jgi:antitoxin component YwqK of YwqJK toxin-antitoxin module
MKTIIIVIILSIISIGLGAEITELKAKYRKTVHIYVTYYYDNGSIAETGRLKDKARDGVWISYDRFGNKLSKAVYTDKEKTGNWSVWSVNGELVLKMIYHKNALESVTNKTSLEKIA